jgi:magnesium transporter
MKPESARQTALSVIDYSAEALTEKTGVTVAECVELKDRATVTWVNVDGLGDFEVLEALAQGYGLHPLVMEDILHTDQRPKVEDYGDYLYIVAQMLYFDEAQENLITEQVSLILGANFVISFQERRGDVFELIRERLRNARGRIRTMGADYLAYALLDAVIDHYFVIMEGLGDDVEALEMEVMHRPGRHTVRAIHGLKREMIYLRRSIWPLRELIANLQRGESRLITDAVQVYLRDAHDHTVRIIETIEVTREFVGGMLDTYLSTMSNRMNEIMKVLTIIATIFMPLTLIVGIYGMNFKHMPELEWRWAYFAVLGLMAGIAGAMLWYFHRRRWL